MKLTSEQIELIRKILIRETEDCEANQIKVIEGELPEFCFSVDLLITVDWNICPATPDGLNPEWNDKKLSYEAFLLKLQFESQTIDITENKILQAILP